MSIALEIDAQIRKLEEEKKLLLKKKEEEGLEEWKGKVKSLIGRYYKYDRQYGWREKVNTNRIHYIKVLGMWETKKVGETQVKVKRMQLAFTPVGWTRKEDGTLKFVVTPNEFHTRRKMDNVITEELALGKEYGVDYEIVLNVNKDGNSFGSGYSSISNFWEECTKEEFLEVEQKAANFGKAFYKEMIQYAGKYKYTEQTEEMISEIDEASLKRIDDLLKSGSNVKQLIEELSGKVARYNYFNGTVLPELVQYQLVSKNGVNLSIHSGDDGTDYEPYVTRYYISRVSIDWAHILYPIRTKLSCKVMELVSKLEGLKSVYSIDNWDCNYSTDSYDAQFRSAKLKQSTLDEVNKLIQKNIK